jgi:hypothetical protein
MQIGDLRKEMLEGFAVSSTTPANDNAPPLAATSSIQ